MTRDEVLDEAWQVAHREVLAATGLTWDANARGRASAAAYIRQEIANLKSKPPEKSPEVGDQGVQAEVAQLRWEANGSPMPGETPRSE